MAAAQTAAIPPIGFAGSNTGYNGSRGYTGSVGYTGSASTRLGYTGSAGSGYTGSASTVQGYTGSRGMQQLSPGFAGSRGYTGYTGSAGTGGAGTSYTGSQGNQGYTGSGASGYTGSAGIGFIGSRGNQGYTGSGASGYTGSAGIGFIGSRGNQGYTGSAGGGGGNVDLSAVSQSIIPALDSQFSLGSSTQRWEQVYGADINTFTVNLATFPTAAAQGILSTPDGIQLYWNGNTIGSGSGYTGSIGAVGYTGSAGTGGGGAGFAGSRGYAGSAGMGATGYTGSFSFGFAGSRGSNGYTGSGGTGYTGSAGPTVTGAYTRTTVSSSATLASDVPTAMNITGFKGYTLYKIQTSTAAWVRVYSNAAARSADTSRSSTVDPSSDAGVLAEVITTGSQTVSFAPTVAGFNDESPATTNIPITVTNQSGSSANVTVTLTLLQTEA